MKAIDYSYFIERYIAGEMDQKEKEWFEKEIEGNDALKNEIILRRKTDQVLARQDLMDLRKKLKAIQVATEEQKTVRIARKKAILRYAAILTLLIMLGGSLLITFTNQPPDTLFRKNFTVYNPGGTVRNTAPEAPGTDSQFRRAMELYYNGEFERAGEVLQDYLLTRPDHMEAHLIYGISSMQSNNYSAAENSFRKIINDRNNLYIDNARWYLALSYIKSGNPEQAKAELRIIAGSSSVYAAKAKQILRKLK